VAGLGTAGGGSGRTPGDPGPAAQGLSEAAAADPAAVLPGAAADRYRRRCQACACSSFTTSTKASGNRVR
ncbi:hypothetical protein JGT96_25305, partial [Enterobacter hormaechei]|uniref:hypothetical protein n=1 Tax=Enterobacter hormaechei TaxID=158836 RepID=UPI0018EB9DC3